MMAVSSVRIAAIFGGVKRSRNQYQNPMAKVMQVMVMILRKPKVGEIFIAAASTNGQPAGQMPTNWPLKVRRNPVAQLRPTAMYSSLSPPGTQYGLNVSR